MDMRFFSRGSLTCLMALWSATAFAAPTEEGASRLAAIFQTFLGSTEGVVSVAVAGEGYSVTLDMNPLFNAGPNPAPVSTTTLSQIAMTVSENDNGTWGFLVDQPFSWSSDLPGGVTSSTDYGRLILTGTYDESLGDISAYRFEIHDGITKQTQNDPVLGAFTGSVVQDSMTWQGTVMAGQAGLNSNSTTEFGRISVEVSGAGPDAMPSGSPIFSVTIQGGSGTSSMTGYEPESYYALVRAYFSVLSLAPEDLDRPALKATLDAALPVFQDIRVTATYQDISVVTPAGDAGLDELGIAFDVTGAVPDGRVRQTYDVKGLTLPDGLLPPWAVPLVPSDASLDVEVSGLDLAAAARLGLDLLGLPPLTPPPAAFGDQMLAALFPEGLVKITLAPGEAKAPAYRLIYEGAMTVGPTQPEPVIRARIGLTGMDGIASALQAAPPEAGMQGSALALATARGFAKPGGEGELVWEIETDATGAVRVNGQDVAGGAP